MDIFINPLRQLVIWHSPLYDGYSECIKLHADLSFKSKIFDLKSSTHSALMHGMMNEKIPSKGWVKLHVDAVNSWEDLWPIAMEAEPITNKEGFIE